MHFGVREVCDVVFKPLSPVDIGDQHFDAGQPVLYIDSATTSSIEGASATVYAQGGKGNPRLIGWDGDKTLTVTIEDALMSPISFAMLSGAGVINGKGDLDAADAKRMYVHTTYDLVVEKDGDKLVARLTSEERDDATLVVSKETPVYPIILDAAGRQSRWGSAITEAQITVEGDAPENPVKVNTAKGDIDASGRTIVFELAAAENEDSRLDAIEVGSAVRIDCYTVHTEGTQEIEIDANTFSGYYYIEMSTLFREEATGEDFPAEFIIPRGKIQSNFTFTMAASGDPSTFTFTIDAFPAYTKFNKTKKVLATLQLIENGADSHNYSDTGILGHEHRTGDADLDDWYTKSVFDKGAATGDGEGDTGNPQLR